ncbi:L-dopachrome tautomerase-related protein [Vibrio sp. WXL103]|uniref:L-dopachrome tautomerase-related protein n=1 Tax=unclassified Vibrio TaxID=2614977 RepID=UPI003EC57A83
MRYWYKKAMLAAALVGGWGLASAQSLAAELEVVATSPYPMNGVAITSEGRTFVSMPQWTDSASPSVAEVMADGQVVPYPGNEWNQFDGEDSLNRFSNVNAVHTDAQGNLWVVDYAAPFWGEIIEGSQKLVKINTTTNQVERVYRFDADILPVKAKLNDVRVDVKAGTAYISEFGVGALIVVDLESGEARRLLDRHFSARAHPDVVTYFDGRPFSTHMLHLNDIELGNNNEYLYYQPTGGPILYRIATKYLLDTSLSADQLQGYVEIYSRSLTIGGITADDKDTFYLGNVQDKAITLIRAGRIEGDLVKDERLLWPDAMAVHDKALYIPCPQLRLLPKFNDGVDKTRGEFTLYRYAL